MDTVRYMPIPDYPSYQAGEDGNIRRLIAPDVWLACSPIKNKDGYYVTSLVNHSGKRVQQRINRLVLLAFIGRPRKGQAACHNNGLRFDNRLVNLRWDTPAGNERDKVQHGTKLIGEKNPQHRLTAPEVSQIKTLINQGIDLTDIGRKFNVTRTSIYWIKAGRNWPHIKPS